MFAKSVTLLTLVASALGSVFVTSPTSSSSFPAGQQALIKWQDDGSAPTLAQFGISKVSIYAGNAIQQTLLQLITDNVDVSKTSAIEFTPNPAIGPNSNQYFIRFESVSAKDPKQPQYPALAFSAKFTLTGMTGTFNASVQAEINGQSTAPLANPTGTPSTNSSSSSSPTGVTATLTKTSASSTGTSTSTHTSATAKASNAAANLKSGPFSLLLAALVGAAVF